MEKLSGKVAVVTGGGSGIGAALVRAFATWLHSGRKLGVCPSAFCRSTAHLSRHFRALSTETAPDHPSDQHGDPARTFKSAPD